MRVLVTGAGGFVGTRLLPILAQDGHEPVAASFDVTDERAAADALAAIRPAAIIHLAAVAAPNDARRDPARAWSVNLHGSLALARAILATTPDALLLFAGTADAYGTSFNTGRPLDETAPLAPQNTYGATKAAADLALGAMAAGEGLRLVRCRPFNHAGPGQTDAFALPAFAHQVARIAAGQQEPVIHVGNLDAARDFLHVDDVCRAYALCLRADLPPGAILNIASGTARPVGDALRTLLALAGLDAEIRIDPARLRPSDIPTASGNASRLRALGWEPRIAWPELLQDVLDDWQKRIETA